MLKKINKNKNRIMSFMCVMMIFISMCGFTSYTVSASEVTEDTDTTGVVYADGYTPDGIISDVYEDGFFNPRYSASNVKIHLSQTYPDYYDLYNSKLSGFTDNALFESYGFDNIIGQLPIYLPNIVGNPFSVDNARLIIHHNRNFCITFVYSVSGNVCMTDYGVYGSSYSAGNLYSDSLFYIVSYTVDPTDTDSDGVYDTYTCGAPSYTSTVTSSSFSVNEADYKLFKTDRALSIGNIYYSDFPVYNEYGSSDINTFLGVEDAVSFTSDSIGLNKICGCEYNYSYLLNDLRPHFYDFSNQELDNEPGDREESYKNHMAFNTFNFDLVSNGAYATSRAFESYTYDDWIKENIGNFRVVTEVKIDISAYGDSISYDNSGNILSELDVCTFNCTFSKDLSTVSENNTIFVSEILNSAVNSDYIGIVEYYDDLYINFNAVEIQNDLEDLVECYFSGDNINSSSHVNSFNEGFDVTFTVYLEAFDNNKTYKSNSYVKHFDLVNRTSTDLSTDITTNNNPWNGDNSSGGIGGALEAVTESFNTIVESGAFNLGDVLSSIGNIVTGSMIGEGAVITSGGSIAIEEGAVSAQASISDGAVSINIDNNNYNVNDVSTDVENTTKNTKSIFEQLFSLLNIFSDNSFLSLFTFVFGFLPDTVLTLMSAVCGVIAVVGLIKFIKK